MPPLARKLALSALSFALLLSLPELALRLAGRTPGPGREEMRADPDTAWSLSPGCGVRVGRPTCINRLGLQGPEPLGGPSLLLTGDSSVFGVGIEDRPTFGQVLGEQLGGRFEVQNAAVPGHSSAQALARLERLLPVLRPRLLVVANLWSDNNFDSFVDAELLAEAGRPARRAAVGIHRLAERSALLDLLLRGRGAGRPEVVGWGRLGQETMGGRRRVPLADYARNLGRMVEAARAQGGEVVFLMLANTEDIDQPARPWAWDPYREVMRQAARSSGCPLVEAPALFREAAARGEGLFVDDMHPSGGGHRVLGLGLAEELRRRGWPEAPLCAGPVAVEVPPDPWTGEVPAPPDARPLLAGLVRGRPGRREPLVVELRGEGEQLLDAVQLPAAAPYALHAEAAPTRARVRVREARSGRRLVEVETALPAWGLHLDLPAEAR